MKSAQTATTLKSTNYAQYLTDINITSLAL